MRNMTRDQILRRYQARIQRAEGLRRLGASNEDITTTIEGK
jgi:hypothetical protein